MVCMDAGLQSAMPGTVRHDEFVALQNLIMGCRRDYI